MKPDRCLLYIKSWYKKPISLYKPEKGGRNFSTKKKVKDEILNIYTEKYRCPSLNITMFVFTVLYRSFLKLIHHHHYTLLQCNILNLILLNPGI